MQPIHNKSNQYFLIAFGLLNTLGFTLLFCGITFLTNNVISVWQFPLACVCAIGLNYISANYFSRNGNVNYFLKSSAIVVGSLIGIIFIFGLFYDVSYDGQWYHQETVIRLKQGYNPVYQQLAVPQKELLDSYNSTWCFGADKPMPELIVPKIPPVSMKYLNINHFGKGIEIIQASVYNITGKIEMAKAVNGIILLITLFLCLSFLYKIGALSVAKKWLIGVLLTFNPIVISQLFTFCVDGNVACLLLCLVAISCLLFVEENNYYFFLLGLIITIVINIKFTSLVFTAIYCTGFLIILLIYKKTDAFKKVLLTGGISVVIGILICGFNPYVTNLKNNHNMFYGLKETQIEINRLTPEPFLNLNRFEKLFLSISAHEGWNNGGKSIRQLIKIPLTLNKEDIHEAGDPQQELSSFGPFFSGEVLIAIIVFSVLSVLSWRSSTYKYSTMAMLIIFATIAIIPDSWWGRFVPQLWLLPIIITFMLEFIFTYASKWFKYILYALISLNVAWGLLGIVFNIFSSAQVSYQIQQLKALNKQPINVEYCSFESFKSNRARFIDAGIPFTEGIVTGQYIYNVIGSNTRFATTVPLPLLPKPLLLKLSDELKGKNN